MRLLAAMRQQRKELIEQCFGAAPVADDAYRMTHARVLQIDLDIQRVRQSFKGDED